MSSTGAIALLTVGSFLLVLGYIQRNGGVRAKKWVARVAALFLFGGLALLLDALSPPMVGLGVAMGSLALAAWFQPWRSD